MIKVEVPMIIYFESRHELDNAFRTEAIKACAHWKPIVEKAIEETKLRILAFQKMANDIRKLLTTTLMIELRQQRFKLKRQEIFLAFINDQIARLPHPEKKLIISTREYMQEVYWNNKPVH